MTKKLKKISFIALALTILISNVAYGTKEIEDLKSDQQKIEEDLIRKSNEISAIQGQISQVSNEIRLLDIQINQSQTELAIIQSRLNELGIQIEENIIKLDTARTSLEGKQNDLYKRLRELYKSGDVVYLEVLLGSSNIEELLTKIDIIKTVTEQDKELIDFTNKQIKFIEETEKLLKEQQAEFEEKQLAEEQKKAQLESANAQKTMFMNSLQQNKVLAENEYDSFVVQTQNISAKIVQLEKELEEQRKAEEARRAAAAAAAAASSSGSSGSATRVVSGSGELVWPVSGNTSISSYYGYRIHPIFNIRKFHSGIDIPAPSGTSIKASSSGIVIYSGWQGGYGNTVMISHGNNLVTLYAHNSSLKVKVGDYVDAGQTVALCGSTGYSTGPHLHFEVRKNGNTVNPLDYL